MEEKGFVDVRIAHRTVLLWLIAIIITLGSAYYQRVTGPTYPARGKLQIGEETIRFELLRTETVGKDAPVIVRSPDGSINGHVRFRRFRSNDEWLNLPMQREGDDLKAVLPHQPAAGKLMYLVFLEKDGQKVSLTGEDPVILRYKGDVPTFVLLPHIFFIFLAMLFSNRAALEALDSQGRAYRHMMITIVLFLLGGMILGPVVQKYAFGAFWTGVPFGFDLTDNKTLIAMLGWLFAWFMNRKGRDGRLWIFLAAILMLVVFLIPHSVLGSEIDYTKLPE